MEPERFMDLAERLLSSNAVPEENCRSAVSRSYYSLYHFALETIKQRYMDIFIQVVKNEPKGRDISEESIRNCDEEALRKVNLHKVIPDTLKIIGERLYGSAWMARVYNRFRTNRNHADYKISNYNVTFIDARNKVANMKEFIKQIKNLAYT